MLRDFGKFTQELCSKVCTCMQDCRAVCSSWCGLSSTAHLNEMHQRSTTPLIVSNSGVRTRIYSINADSTKKPWLWRSSLSFKDLTIPCQTVLFSCDSLLLVKSGRTSDREYAICNPVTREEVGFSLETGDTICGFFFHPLDQEYKLLILNDEMKISSISYYFLYGFSTKDRRPPRKAPGRQETQGSTTLGASDRTLDTEAGVAVSGAVFWNCTARKVLNGVTVKVEYMQMFDFETENFTSMPQPADRYKRESRTQTKLLEFERKLWCCDVYDKYVEVFILEDVESWRWNKRYVVHLDRYINKGPDRGESDAKTSVVGILNGNLVLFRSYVGLLWCNLRLNTVMKIKNVPYDDDLRLPFLSDITGLQYTRSLLSIRKFNIFPDNTSPSPARFE